MRKIIGTVFLILLILAALGSCVDKNEESQAEVESEVVEEISEEVVEEDKPLSESGYDLFVTDLGSKVYDCTIDGVNVRFWEPTYIGCQYSYNVVFQNCNSSGVYITASIEDEEEAIFLDAGEINHVLLYSGSPNHTPKVNIEFD